MAEDFDPTGATKEEIDRHEAEDRKDQTRVGKPFPFWLQRNEDREEYAELAEILLPIVKSNKKLWRFDFEAYSEILTDHDRPDLGEVLLVAATEWRADAASRHAGGIRFGKDEVAIRRGATSITEHMPIPVVPCSYKDPRTLTKCTDASIPGALRCRRHGGDWIDPRIRQHLLMASYMTLVEGTEIAVEALLYVAQHGRREEARVMAAKEILDRAGIRAGVDIHVVHEDGDAESQIAKLHDRLDRMAESITAKAELETKTIVDAEIVEDEPEPESELNAEPVTAEPEEPDGR